MDSQRKFKKTFSFEFFPPKTDKGREKLLATAEALKAFNPDYVSVTYGAGGTTRAGTEQTIRDLLAMGLDAAPHLSCIGSSRDDIRELLDTYRKMGVKRIVALRGDMPSGMRDSGELHYANELVAFIRQETGDEFHIEVAAYPEFHPQAKSATADLRNFKRKVDAGANAAITQYFYNVDAYLRFVDDCERLGIDLPIVPGIMPIANFQQLARFSDACGAEIPRWLRWRMEGFGDDLESVRAYGMNVMKELCGKLLDSGAPGLHFYTMNLAPPASEVLRSVQAS